MSRRRRRNVNSKKTLPPRAQGLNKKLKNIKEINHRKKKAILKTTKNNKISPKRNLKSKATQETENVPEEVPEKDNITDVQLDDAVLSKAAVSNQQEALPNDINDESNDMADEGEGSLVIDENVDDAEIPVCDENNDADASTSEQTNQTIVDENHNESSAGKLSVEDMMGDLSTDSSPMKHHSISSTPGQQVHQCPICSKSLSSASSLDRHMLVHSGERPFKCKLCDMSFTTNGNMHRHMRTHGETENGKKEDSGPEVGSQDREEPKLHCPVCGKGFLCKYGLQSHMDTHPNDPIMCQKCEVISVNYRAHIEHTCNLLKKCQHGVVQCGFQDLTFMDFTSDKFSLVSKSYCEQNVKRPSSAFHAFECGECKKAFPCGRALKLHQKTHEAEIGTFCPSCQCDFAAASFLQVHQLKHRSAEHCPSNPLHDTGLSLIGQNRTKSHAGKEDFLALLNLQTKQSQLSFLKSLKACNVKEDNFENMDYFVHGKLKKNETKPGEADTANNINDFADIQSIISLTSKANLISPAHTSPVAMRSASPLNSAAHHPKSPKVAESAIASPETPSKEDMQSLQANHNVPDVESFIESHGVFPCTICSQRFRNSSALKRHCKLHFQKGSNYSCHICSYVSVDKSTLIRHLRTHNGERPFQCVICKYAFTTKANCERHVRKRHKKFGKVEIRNAMQYNPNMSHRAGPDPTSPDISNSETVCKYCGVDFKFNRVLRHHLRSLHNSCNRKPFSCKICKFGFSTKNNCIRHVLKQHPNLKDKLRSVVIPNSQMSQMDTSELTSSNTDNSNSSTCNQPVKDQSLPLDLHHSTNKEKPLNLHKEKNCDDRTANEAVMAAEGLVSLSEAPPLQDEPLDLAVHAIDLSVKPFEVVTQKPDSKTSSILNAPPCTYKPIGFIDLTTSKTPAGTVPDKIIQISPLPITNCSKKVEPVNKTDMPLAPGQKQRAFTCIYCSAGFTLKSNMERHIKRKHPEFARPTRSRNFIPSIVPPNLQKQNSTTLSDKTRDALRNVLSSKVQQVPVYKNITTETFSKLGGTFKIVSSAHSFLSPVKQAPGHKSVLNLSLDLSRKAEKAAILDLKNACIPKANENGQDEGCSDLASVSSVICTANSPQFIQYLGKSSDIEKMEVDSPEDKKELSPISDNSKNEPSVSCPFCERKFPWTSSLRRHILTHTGQKPYKCPKCSLWFTTKSNCERHLIRKHGHKGDLITRSVPDRPYKCNHCLTSTFSTQGNLRKHFYLKHWTKSYLGMNSKLSQVDKKNGDNSSSEKVHKAVKPKSSPVKGATVSSVTTQEHSYSQTEKKLGFACNFCDSRFGKLAELKKHMLKHSSVMYMCYLCRKTFPSHEDCYNHFKTSHSLVYIKINSTDEDVMKTVREENAEDTPDASTEDTIASMACMVCFQKMSSVENLQHHFKRHLRKDKQVNSKESIPTSEPSPHEEPTTSHSKTSSTILASPNSKKARLAKGGKVKNSLLYFFTQTPSSTPLKPMKTAATKLELVAPEEDSDLIQNLLGIHDSKMIDEMLVSADSAARLLGMKEV